MAEQTKLTTEETTKNTVELLAKNTAARSLDLAKRPVVQIRNNQIIAGVVGTAGLIIFALGVENLIRTIPALSSPYIEIAVGLVMLSFSGLLLKKLF